MYLSLSAAAIFMPGINFNAYVALPIPSKLPLHTSSNEMFVGSKVQPSSRSLSVPLSPGSLPLSASSELILEMPFHEKLCTSQSYNFEYTDAISRWAPSCGLFIRSFIVTVRGASSKKDFLQETKQIIVSRPAKMICLYD